MHSRIFVLSDNKTTTPDDFFCPWGNDPRDWHPLVDYVTPTESFLDDIKWLEETYGIQVSWDDNNKPYLSIETLKRMKNKLEEILKKRIEEVETLIKEAKEGKRSLDDWLMYDIAQKAWNRLEFFFLIDGETYKPLELLSYFNSYEYNPLWIIAIYDYHF
jgi:hypothetical protein